MNDRESSRQGTFLYTAYFIYFFCGLTQCFEGVILPEFKDFFKSSYLEQMLIPFAKNIPFVLAVGIGFLIHRLGYKHCLSIAMFLYAAGTFLLVPGLHSRQYWLVLLAFLAIGTGFNFQIVAGNPLLSALGPSAGSSSRLNLGNALGAVAQIIAPATLSFIIPATLVNVEDKLPYIARLFVALGVILTLTAVFTLLLRTSDAAVAFEPSRVAGTPDRRRPLAWAQPRVWLGFVTIFLVLGAEAVLFSNYRNYLLDPAIAGLSAPQSLTLNTTFMAIFAAGRLTASWVQKRVAPAATLVFNLVVSLVLLGVIMTTRGTVAVVAVTAIGFFVSIFFPTLYALAIEGMGEQTAQASGLLTMGFLGCAFLPVLQGWLADRFGLQASYASCIVPYLFALLYTLRTFRSKS